MAPSYPGIHGLGSIFSCSQLHSVGFLLQYDHRTRDTHCEAEGNNQERKYISGHTPAKRRFSMPSTRFGYRRETLLEREVVMYIHVLDLCKKVIFTCLVSFEDYRYVVKQSGLVSTCQ